MTFTSEWLNTRRKYDEKARNLIVLKKLFQVLPNQESHLLIWDLGAGTCNSLKTFPNLFFGEGYLTQTWYFIEKDQDLLKQGYQEGLTTISLDNRKECSSHNNCIEVTYFRQGYRFEGHFLNIDMESLGRSYFQSPNLIMANALFDLLYPELIETLVAQYNDSIWYSSLNHQATHLLPKTKSNLLVAQAYDRHTVQKDQKRLGIQTCSKVPRIMEKHGFNVTKGKSRWEITRGDDPIMFRLLWQFIRNAVSEMRISPKTIQKAEEECSEIVVDHCDFLAVPKSH